MRGYLIGLGLQHNAKADELPTSVFASNVADMVAYVSPADTEKLPSSGDIRRLSRQMSNRVSILPAGEPILVDGPALDRAVSDQAPVLQEALRHCTGQVEVLVHLTVPSLRCAVDSKSEEAAEARPRSGSAYLRQRSAELRASCGDLDRGPLGLEIERLAQTMGGDAQVIAYHRQASDLAFAVSMPRAQYDLIRSELKRWLEDRDPQPQSVKIHTPQPPFFRAAPILMQLGKHTRVPQSGGAHVNC